MKNVDLGLYMSLKKILVISETKLEYLEKYPQRGTQTTFGPTIYLIFN
jgi:hypothetical protein